MSIKQSLGRKTPDGRWVMLWILQSWERMSFMYGLPLNSEERLTLGLNAVVTIFLILTLPLNVCFLSEVWQDRGLCRELSPRHSSPPRPGLLVTCSLTPTQRRLCSLPHPTNTPCLRVCDSKTAKKKHPCEDERERSQKKEKSFFPAFWGGKKSLTFSFSLGPMKYVSSPGFNLETAGEGRIFSYLKSSTVNITRDKKSRSS